MTDGSMRETGEGVVVRLIGGVIGIGATLGGAHVLEQHIIEPVLPGSLILVELLVVWAGILICTVVVLLSSILIISSVIKPTIADRSIMQLIGVGGLIGVVTAILWSASTRLSHGWWTDYWINQQVAPSIVTLAVIATPLVYLFYDFCEPIEGYYAPASQSEPEFVRDKNERWSDESVDGGDQPLSEGNTSINVANDSDSKADNEFSNSSLMMDANELRFGWSMDPGLCFEDVGGMDSIKAELQRDIIKPLTTHREQAESLDISTPNVIFHGPPGTGKTYLAKSLAGELGFPFVELSGADLQSKWINESAQLVKDLFDEAKSIAKADGGAVIFIDEIDSVLKERSGTANVHEEDRKVVNEFLNNLEDITDYDVLAIGATNRLSALDEAGIRAGRIDKKIGFSTPDTTTRESIIRAQLRDKPHRLTDSEIRYLAEKSEGLTAADLTTIIDDAARFAAFERGGERIIWSDVQRVSDDGAV